MADTEQGIEGAGASRRRFLELAGGAGAAGVASTLVMACGDEQGGGGGGDVTTVPGEAEEESPASEPGTDLEILKYLLFLEYLERDFYAEVTAGGQVQDSELRKLTRDFHGNEVEHVQALAALVRQLAGTAIQPPKTKFDSIVEAGDDRILEVASVLENLGAAAYLGQVDKIQNNRILELVLSTHSVEARHAAAVNDLAGLGLSGGKLKGTLPDGAFGKPVTREEALSAASPYVKP